MMEGSSLRMMVGMYSALGTLEEMSWGHRERLRGGSAAWEPRGSRSPRGQPTRSSSYDETPQGSPMRHPLTLRAAAASLPGRQQAPVEKDPQTG